MFDLYGGLTPRVLDFVAAMVAFVNAVSMVLMASSTLAWSSTTEVTVIDIAVALLQLLVLLGELRPIPWSFRARIILQECDIQRGQFAVILFMLEYNQIDSSIRNVFTLNRRPKTTKRYLVTRVSSLPFRSSRCPHLCQSIGSDHGGG